MPYVRDDYSSSQLRGRVVVDQDFKTLVSSDTKGARADLLVWRSAMASPELQAAFAGPGWVSSLLADLEPSSVWPWRLVRAEGAGTASMDDKSTLLDAVRAATGECGTPDGNVMVSLELRDYQERSGSTGGLEWWVQRSEQVITSGGCGAALVRQIATMLSYASRAGSEIFVEQLAIVLAKDRTAPLATLTPTLHSDEYYGRRETAICSLLEKGYNSRGGAVFVPTRRMSEVWSERPIDVAKMERTLSADPLVCTGSGDILIYDGMISAEGIPDPANGVPHISPDIPGDAARLVCLMYHRRRSE